MTDDIFRQGVDQPEEPQPSREGSEQPTPSAPAEQPGAEEKKQGGEKKGAKKEKTSFKQDLYYWLQALSTVLAVVLLFFALVGRPIRVDGNSMYPTLHDNDLILIRSLAYTPEQGDIVVLRQTDFRTFPIVKRVIATEGQTVHIDYDAGTVSVDGVVLDEPYVNQVEVMYNTGLAITDITIPEGCIFVMGDNRNHSDDSRNPTLGAVDARYVLGKATVILLPFQDIGLVH